MNATLKQEKRKRRHKKIRSRISGTGTRPRLSIFKSNTGIYAQLIDDTKGVTLGAARGKNSVEVGKSIANQALEKKIKSVVFDRGGYNYTGKIKTLADSARKAGLKF